MTFHAFFGAPMIPEIIEYLENLMPEDLYNFFFAYLCFTKTSHFDKAIVIVNGQNSRHNRTSYPNLATIIHKLEEYIGVKK